MKNKLEVIQSGEFNFIYVKTKPPRLEARIIFDREHISQTLIFTMMNIAHTYGFGCSAPIFNGVNDPSMIFMIGTVLHSVKAKDTYIKRMTRCLADIRDFSMVFVNQLDFSNLDLTMFSGVDLDDFNPEKLISIRDQYYYGSWDSFCSAMKKEKKKYEASVIKKCIKFEKINKKNIGLVGHKLSNILYYLNDKLNNNFYIN